MGKEVVIRFCHRILILVVGLLFLGQYSIAEDKNSVSIERASFSDHRPSVQVSPVELTGGSTLTIISPSKWNSLSDKLRIQLEEIHNRYTKLFGEIPVFTIAVKLMEEEDFYRATGAPRWTNAMYYKKSIMIPLSGENIDSKNLTRSLVHEYTHAVIHALSMGRAPGWLDEGLAQWAEGEENPALRPALISWLRRKQPVPLNLLQGGFTRLDAAMVPAAYAQSIFAAKHILSGYGIDVISKFFNLLRSGSDKDEAFNSAFGVSEEKFEKDLGGVLEGWVNKHRQDPGDKA